MNVESNYLIAIAMLSNKLKLAPVSQPMKTNAKRTMKVIFRAP